MRIKDNDKGRLYSINFEMHRAFYFYKMSRRRFEYVLGLIMTCGGLLMITSALHPSQTALRQIHRSRSDGRLGWPGGNPNQEPGNGCMRHPVPPPTELHAPEMRLSSENVHDNHVYLAVRQECVANSLYEIANL